MITREVEDRFSIIGEIHQGHWTVSYKALDKSAQNQVFLKLLNSSFLKDSEIVTRFKREVILAGKIAHPNVVRMLDHGEIASSYFISFEWLDGKSLDKHIQIPENNDDQADKSDLNRNSRLPAAQVVSYAKQILAGLSAVHRAGIVHRDLKPNNIIADEKGNIHVLDFSLAYAPADTRVTAHHNIVGTPGYLAPEVIAGADANVRSDLFAAGIIICEMLIGRPLFSSKDIYTTLQNVHEAEIPDIAKYRDDVPAELWALTKKLLAKHPFDRYASAAEALEVLQIITPEAELPVSPGKKSSSRLRTSLTLASILIICGGIISVGIIGDLTRNTHPDDTADFSASPATDTTEIEFPPVEDTIITRQIEFGEASVEASGLSPAKITHNEVKEDPFRPERTSSLDSNTGLEESETGLPGKMIPIVENVPVIDYPDSAAVAENDKDSLKITFDIFPWAKVYCDGRFMGTTPILKDIEIPAGRYDFRFEHTEFPPFSKIYDILPGDSQCIELDLTGEFGLIEFSVNPWGYLIIDEIERGTVPSAKPIFIQPGEHTIRIKHPSYHEILRVLSIAAGETLTVAEDFLK